MNERTKAAIPQVIATHGAQQRTGTAFLVSDRFALTAFHVVGDRAAALGGSSALFESITLSFRGARTAITATVVPDAYSAIDDWALLSVNAELAELSSIRIGELAAASHSAYEAYGYPTEHHNPLTVVGRVLDPSATYFGAMVIQLHCEQLAAGSGDPLNGLSGAPCLVNDIAVGIVRAHPVSQSEVGSRLRVTVKNGVLYACPTSQFKTALSRICVETSRLDDCGSVSPSPAAIANARSALAAIPIAPLVFSREIPDAAIKAFSERFGDPEKAKRFFSLAMQLLSQCNPEQFSDEQILLTHGEVRNPFAVSADEYWADVLTAAGSKSRRTLAAFLLTPGAPDPETLRPDLGAILLGFTHWLGRSAT